MRWLSIIAFSLANLTFFGQESSFSAKLDTSAIQIGKQLFLEWEVRTPAQNEVVWPEWIDTISGLELLQSSAIDTVYDAENIAIRIFRQQHQITSFDSGYYAIPPAYAKINDSLLGSNPLLLTVQNVQLDSALVMKDIKGPMEVDYGFLDWLKIYWPQVLIGIAILFILSLLGYFFVRKREVKIEFIPSKPAIPAHVIALEKLKTLDEQKLWQAGEMKEYYSLLSEIVREFIEARFSNLALEMSTPEILADMKEKELEKEALQILTELLPLTDMAKFAKVKPIGEENEAAMQQAMRFVSLTQERKEESDVS